MIGAFVLHGGGIVARVVLAGRAYFDGEGSLYAVDLE